MKQLLFVSALLTTLVIYASPSAHGAGKSLTTQAMSVADLQNKQWIHGREDCKKNPENALDIYRHDSKTYILRQSKCLSYEAPFLYLLIGDEKAILLDTGATKVARDFPVYETVRSLIEQAPASSTGFAREIVVLHSHGHRDHYAGDKQFANQPNVTLVKPKTKKVIQFFEFGNWPEGEATMQLGGREITVIPSPGHQEAAITVYDPHTQWLLTGDTLYPGYIIVKHWQQYTATIARLTAFTKTHAVTALLGAHIEMTKTAGSYYPIGTRYQPNEAQLVLMPEHLSALDAKLSSTHKPQQLDFDKFVIAPMGTLQKTISNVARWFL